MQRRNHENLPRSLGTVQAVREHPWSNRTSEDYTHTVTVTLAKQTDRALNSKMESMKRCLDARFYILGMSRSGLSYKLFFCMTGVGKKLLIL